MVGRLEIFLSVVLLVGVSISVLMLLANLHRSIYINANDVQGGPTQQNTNNNNNNNSGVGVEAP